MKKNIKLFILVLAASLIPIMAWANMAIPIENPVDQRIIFDPDSKVSMLEETVAFSFTEESRLYSAEVNVSYLLRNESDENKQVEMIFVTPYMGEGAALEVISGGKTLATSPSEKFKEMPENWEASRRMPIFEPISGKILENSPSVYEGAVSKDGEAVWGTRFSVDLPAREDTRLEVIYYSESGIYRYQNVINEVFSQIYYLTPAKFYEGEAKVTLKVDFPESMDLALTSNLPMEKIGENKFIAELEGLPEEEWLFSFTDKEGLPLGTNDRTLNNGIILGIFAAIIGFSIWFWKKKGRKLIAICGGVIAACSLAFFRPSYGMVFLLYMASPLIGIVALVFVAVWIVKIVRLNKRKL